MGSMPYDPTAYNNYLASLTGKSMVGVPQNMPPPAKPALLPFSQFPPSFITPQVPYPPPPMNVQWNAGGHWVPPAGAMPPAPPFPGSFQPMSRQPLPTPSQAAHQTPINPMGNPQTHVSNGAMTQTSMTQMLSAKSPSFLPNQTNSGQWPPLPNFVPSNSPNGGAAKTKQFSAPPGFQTPSLLTGLAPQSRAVSCPPPPALSPNSLATGARQNIIPCRNEPFKQLCAQLRQLLDKIVPLNFDSTASRIRKMLTASDKTLAVSDTDQFCEAVRIIVEQGVGSTENQDAFNLYINLFRSLSKAEFAPEVSESKPVNFLNTVVNCCFTLLHIRNSPTTSENEKSEKDDDKDSNMSGPIQPQSRSKSVGAIRLIAALYRAKEIPKGQIVDCVNRLVRLETENSVACLHELLRLIGRDFDEMVKAQKDKQTWWSNLFETLRFVERRSATPPKIRALILEIIDARENNWIFPESNDDELFRDELRSIMESLPENSDTSANELFAIASKRLRQLIQIAERHPYLFAEMMDAMLAKCHFYHNEVLGTGKSVVDTQKFARMQIELDIMSKHKTNFSDQLKAKDKTIASLEERNRQLEAEISKLTKEIFTKEKTIEEQMLNEANYRSNIQQAFDAKVEEFRKQLAIQLQAYIGNQ